MTKEDQEQLAKNIVDSYIKNGAQVESPEQMVQELLESWEIWDEFIHDMKTEE